jgi:hypothetical protein
MRDRLQAIGPTAIRCWANTLARRLMPLPDFLILIGPIGVGKSHIALVLATHFPCEYVSVETFFKRRYPTPDAFRADQPAAYAALHDHLMDTLHRTRSCVVFEQVALSEQEVALISDLQRDHATVLAEIWAGQATSFRRVESRGTGANFPKDTARLLRVRNLYQANVRPRYEFALSLRNDDDLSDDAICRAFDVILGPRRGTR